MAIYGDLGSTDQSITPELIRRVDSRDIDAVIHIGDMAYNFVDDDGRVGE